MKISVVTAAYNAATTIADAMRSVARQDHRDVEHIVIDGASRDGTATIARDGIRTGGIVVSEPDGGIYDAMNKGIARATGDVVAILNADDFYADDTILSQVARVFAERDVDAVLSDVAFIDGVDPNRLTRRYRSDRFRPGRVAWGWMPAHPGMFLTRAAYDDMGPYRTDYRIAADFEFVARAFGRGRLRYVHVPLVTVLMREGGVSTGGIGATLTIARECVRACRENGIRSNLAMIATKFPLKLLERWV